MSLNAAFDAISEILPFALAYQGEDDLEPMTAWGAHVSKIAAALFNLAVGTLQKVGRSEETRKLGIIQPFDHDFRIEGSNSG